MPQTQGNNPFDDEIRKRLEGASFQPPKGIWDKIEKQLPEKLPFYFRFKYPIAAAMLTFSLVSSLVIYNRYENSLSDTQLRFAKNKIDAKDNILPKSQSSNLQTDHYTTSDIISEAIPYLENNSEANSNVKSIIQSSSSTSVNSFDGASYSTQSKSSTSNEFSKKSTPASKKEKRAERKQKSISSEDLNENSENFFKEAQYLHFLDNSSNVAEELSIESPMLNKDIESIEKMDLFATNLFEDDENPELTNKFEKGKRKSFKNKFVNSGLVIGPLLGGHYSAMTKKSDEGVNTSNLEQSATFGKSYGVNVGYVINNRWTVGMEWIYNSDEGQRFTENINGQKVNKYVALDYMKIPLYVKYSYKFINRYDKTPITFNFVGGIHYSKLKSVNTYIENQIAPVEVNYNEQEWGMLGGVEFDIYATNRIFFTLGTRLAFNADLKQFPRLRGDDGADPFSVQTGVYAKINYAFSFKKAK
ncbi:MAG TPA: outer membrane beta-barrel protein [Chitinophagales bacterium]|nr:outer membrane beta-barrel protein [Chitinophagales bacterium]